MVPRGSPQDTPAAATLQNRELLYLRQNDGTAVLFDPQEKRAIYVQASDIVMRLSTAAGDGSAAPLPAVRYRLQLAGTRVWPLRVAA